MLRVRPAILDAITEHLAATWNRPHADLAVAIGDEEFAVAGKADIDVAGAAGTVARRAAVADGPDDPPAARAGVLPMRPTRPWDGMRRR